MRILLVIFSVFLIKSSLACERPLILSFNGDWAPYFYNVGDSTYVGTDFFILTQTLEDMSCSLEVLPMTPQRAAMETSKGTFDIFIGASYTPARNSDFFYTIAYREEHVGFAYNTLNLAVDTDQIEVILENKGEVALNMQGYFGDYIETLKKRYPHQFVHAFSTYERMQMLNKGLVAAVVDDKSALCKDAKRFIKNPKLKRYLISTQELHRDEVHFIFNRSTVTQQFIETFNEVLSQKLKSSFTEHTNPCS